MTLVYMLYDGVSMEGDLYYVTYDIDNEASARWGTAHVPLAYAADIPGEDLNIVCLNGYILICRDAALNEQELFAVMDSLGITADIFDRLENDPETAVRQLTEELPEIVEGELENNGIYD